MLRLRSFLAKITTVPSSGMLLIQILVPYRTTQLYVLFAHSDDISAGEVNTSRPKISKILILY